jgi:hypothetical protein
MIWKRIKQTPSLSLVSPATLLALSVLFSSVFLALHAAGFREHTSVFSGTYPEAHDVGLWTLFGAIVYALSYLLFVFVVPVLTLASMIFIVISACLAKTRLAPDSEARSK